MDTQIPNRITIKNFIIIISLLCQPDLIHANALNPSTDLDSESAVLSLEKAKQIALENNPSIDAALERIKQARESIVQAKADYYPSVLAATDWNYTEKTQKSSPTHDETQHSGNLSMTQTLFNGFYTKYAVLAKEKNQKAAAAGYENTKRILSWSVSQAYLNTQLAAESIKIAQSDMWFNQKQEEEAVAKKRAGTGSYSDVLNFKTKVNTAASSLLSARQDFMEAKISLAALLGFPDSKLPADMQFEPLPQRISDETPNDSDFSIEDILYSRPDLQETFLFIKEADANIKIAQASYFPTVSLSAAYGASAGDHFLDEDNMGASAGINVSFNIFTGGARKSKVIQAQSKKRELERTYAAEKIQAVSDISATVEKIRKLMQQLLLQEENTNLIKETRDLVEKEYRAGQSSLVRLNEAQNELVKAQGQLSSNKVSLMLAREELAYYIGKNYTEPSPER